MPRFELARPMLLALGILATQQPGTSSAQWVQTTTIGFALPRAMPARLVVYDVAGRGIRTLANLHASGERYVTWDGRDASGHRVGRGMYLGGSRPAARAGRGR